RCVGGRLTQRMQVFPHQRMSALVAAFLDLLVERGGIMTAFLPALLQIGGESIYSAGMRGALFAFRERGRIGKGTHGFGRQVQMASDGADVPALSKEGAHFLIAFEPTLTPTELFLSQTRLLVAQRDNGRRNGERRTLIFCSLGFGGSGRSRRLFEQGALVFQQPFQRLPQVLDQMPSVCHL